MPILAFGSIGFQAIHTPFGRTERVLGGSAATFALAASYFDKVLLVAAIGRDFGAGEQRLLEDRGIDLRGVAVVDGPSYSQIGEYGFGLAERRLLQVTHNVAARFDPVIPDDYRDAPMVYLGEGDPAQQRRVLHQVRNPSLVVARTSEHWIETTGGSLQETLLEVDLLLLGEAEARLLSREEDLRRAARMIRELGPTSLLVVRVGGGVLVFGSEGVVSCPGYPLEAVRDPTGRVDAFAGGFVGYLASQGDSSDASFRKGIVCGAVLGSFAVEAPGLQRLRRLEEPEFRERYVEFRRLLRFDEWTEGDPSRDVSTLED